MTIAGQEKIQSKGSDIFFRLNFSMSMKLNNGCPGDNMFDVH